MEQIPNGMNLTGLVLQRTADIRTQSEIVTRRNLRFFVYMLTKIVGGVGGGKI